MKKSTSRAKAAVRPSAEPAASAAAGSARGGDGGSGLTVELLDAGRQAQAFESAAALFHSGRFRPAQELFHQAARGPNREMAHSALLHVRMCQRRLDAAGGPRTPEDHYNFAVALINQHRLEAAEQHLRTALDQAPDADHLYYVLALCRALGGDLAGAHAHLRRAIELRPQNRIAARNDPDFADLGQQAPLRELLYPERIRSG